MRQGPCESFDSSNREKSVRVHHKLHFDLVRGISAHHVLNRQLASGMPLEPFVQAQDLVVQDDNGLVVRNKPFDLAARENAGAAHIGGLGGRSKRTKRVKEGRAPRGIGQE